MRYYLLILLLLFNVVLSKTIIVSDHQANASMYDTNDIIDVQLAGGTTIFIYYYEIDDNPKIIPATRYSQTQYIYKKHKKHTSYVFETFNDALMEYEKIVKAIEEN